MPTKKKRVGFIPREDVMRIIDNLSIENNLSNSKIISILVEEALSIRGIFNKKNGKANQSYKMINDLSPNLSNDSADFIDKSEFSIGTKLGINSHPSKSEQLNEVNHNAFNFDNYKKFILFLKFQEMMDKYNT